MKMGAKTLHSHLHQTFVDFRHGLGFKVQGSDRKVEGSESEEASGLNTNTKQVLGLQTASYKCLHVRQPECKSF